MITATLHGVKIKQNRKKKEKKRKKRRKKEACKMEEVGFIEGRKKKEEKTERQKKVKNQNRERPKYNK